MRCVAVPEEFEGCAKGFAIADALYNEMQVVYAKSKSSMRTRVHVDDGATETSNMPTDVWLHLLYPMKEIENASTRRIFMRCKMVDEDTGQLHVLWACIFEVDKKTDVTTRHVGNRVW